MHCSNATWPQCCIAHELEGLAAQACAMSKAGRMLTGSAHLRKPLNVGGILLSSLLGGADCRVPEEVQHFSHLQQ